MGTAIAKKDTLREGYNVFKEWIGTDAYRVLERILPEKCIPWVTKEWETDMKTRYQQALSLPMVFDHMQTRRMFPITDTESVDIQTIARHFAFGLTLRNGLAKRLQLPEQFAAEATCALGYGRPLHHASAEFGLTMAERDVPYSEFSVQVVTKLLIRRLIKLRDSRPDVWNRVRLDDYEHVRSSFPRGKNTGFPIYCPGSNRLMSDLVMAVDAGIAKALLHNPHLASQFRGDFFNAYVVFSRYQSSGRAIPMHYRGQDFTSFNFEARRRIINSGSKPWSMALKPLVEWSTVMLQEIPEYSQSRDELLRRRKRAKRIYCIDSSRFDLHMGSKKLRQAIKILWAVTKFFFPKLNDAIYDLAETELTLPTLVDTDYDRGVVRLSTYEVLRSGSILTQRIGGIGNLCQDVDVKAELYQNHDVDKMVTYYLEHDPTVIMGDDNEGYYDEDVTLEKFNAALAVVNKALDVDMEVEEPAKFIGLYVTSQTNVASSEIGLFHGTRSYNNLFFPERPRSSAVCSFLVRRLMTENTRAADAAELITRLMQDQRFLMQEFKRFHRDVYPVLAGFYRTHPNGAMRQYFKTFPSDPAADVAAVQKQLFADIDEILEIFAHGSAFDFNTGLLGVDGDGPGTAFVQSSINELVEDLMRKVFDSGKASAQKMSSFGPNADIIRRVAEWFRSSNEDEFLARVMKEGPFVFRSIETQWGRVMTTYK